MSVNCYKSFLELHPTVVCNQSQYRLEFHTIENEYICIYDIFQILTMTDLYILIYTILPTPSYG
jgi:hypothetical protein